VKTRGRWLAGGLAVAFGLWPLVEAFWVAQSLALPGLLRRAAPPEVE